MKSSLILIFGSVLVAFLFFGCLGNQTVVPQNYTQINNSNSSSSDNPTWVKEFIKNQLSEPVANPPASLTKCEWKGQTVYYLPPRCCDIQSELYDKEGNLICRPDGGIAANGDGKCPDFNKEKQNCEVIWTDSRGNK